MNPYQPAEARILERFEESADLITLRLKLTNDELQKRFEFEPGQFNMLYLYGVGEIPVSIVSDPKDSHIIDHTIRVLGRVTRGMNHLQPGDRIGIRGPFGRGWPVRLAENKDVIVVTGGLGCAPVVSVITYIEHRRQKFGHLNIVQGVKHSSDFFWKARYDRWRKLADTRVMLAADAAEPLWPGHIGLVTDLFDNLKYDKNNCIVMMCGPEGMMHAVIHEMTQRGVDDSCLYLSMERNMQCATGFCGHCQYGSQFICKDGPVFSYPEISQLFKIKGF